MIAVASQLVNVYAILKANKVFSAHIIASGAKIMSMIIIGMKSIMANQAEPTQVPPFGSG